jgi:CBS domain-containing membrane protein
MTDSTPPSSDPEPSAPGDADPVLDLEEQQAKGPPGPPPKANERPSRPPPRPLPTPKSVRPKTLTSRPLPPRKFPPVTVADIMTRKVIALQPDDTIENIDVAMKRYRFRHFPVIDKDGGIAGILTHRDLLHALSSSLSDERVKYDEIIRRHVRVSNVMRREVLTVPPDEPVVEAGQLLWEKKIGSLPVVDADGKLVGIVTEADYLRLALALLTGVRPAGLPERDPPRDPALPGDTPTAGEVEHGSADEHADADDGGADDRGDDDEESDGEKSDGEANRGEGGQE